MLCRVCYVYGISSVCPSVTFVDCDHTGWNYSKVISHLVILGCSLCADPNCPTSWIHYKVNTLKIWPEYGWGMGKVGFQPTKALISVKCGKIGPRLLLRTNRKSHVHFRLVPKSTTLDDLQEALCCGLSSVSLSVCNVSGLWSHTLW